MAIEIAQNLDAVNMIRAQQSVVGRSIIGSAGAVGGGDIIKQEVQIEILEDIRRLSNKTFKAIKLQTDTIVKLLNFDKEKDRRDREQAAETAKENKASNITKTSAPGSFKDMDIEKQMGGNFSILEFLGISSILGKFKKFFAPLGRFVNVLARSKLGLMFGRLAPFFAGSGPLALIAGAIFLLFQYSKEIAAALTPAVEALKQAFDYLKPVFDIILSIGDAIIKTGILAIGTSLSLVFETLALTIGTLVSSVEFVYNLIKGIVTGDMNLIANAWTKVKSSFQSLGDRFINAIKSLYNGIIDSLPLPDKLKNKLKLEVKEIPEEPEEVTNTTKVEDDKSSFVDNLANETTSSNTVASLSEPKQVEDEKPVIAIEKKPKVINIDDTSSATQVAENMSGNPDLPPLGLNMYKTTGDTWRERADQWNAFKKALQKAEKDGSISGKELEFRVMQLKAEKDSLQNDKKILDIKKQRAELTGESVDEASFLKERDASSKAQQERILAEDGMTVASFDKDLNQTLKPNVNKRDLQGDTQTASTGTVITDAKQTVVTNSNINKQETYTGAINTSSGDGYFDRQSGSYAT
jgi:hypothetical protein